MSKKENEALCNITLDNMNCVLIGTEESRVHVSFNAEFLLQGFRVTFNQGVVSGRFIDVDLIVLQVFGGSEKIFIFSSVQLKVCNEVRRSFDWLLKGLP